ncbi:MAG: dihydroorotate dehydrogenase [Blastocatellia bacterium]|nr:dihydroorotate dehydrogenase [Blastocatellia bacterium]
MLYRSLLRPILFRLPPETAHAAAMHSLSFAPGLTSRFLGTRFQRSPFGKLQRFGLKFDNPVGLAAGFDKDGIALESLAALGFGFIEAGTVTYQPQPGNPRPRLFRLPADKALINRAGFNNAGAMSFAASVSRQKPKCVVGVSIGKSKTVELEGAIDDYLRSFAAVYHVADYVAVNVSSPNTPRLRELQRADQLDALLRALQKRNRELAEKSAREPLPLLVKLSPDLEAKSLPEIVAVALQNRVAGLIATNTTTERTHLRTPARQVADCGMGGLSGAPLRRRSTEVIATLFNLTNGSMPLIGVGGIFTAADAWEKICAGASLVQLYTGLIYEGPAVARMINEGLAQLLLESGFRWLDEAVGSRANELAEL